MAASEGAVTEVTEALPATKARSKHYRLRFWLAIVLVVLSVLAIIISCVAVWAHRTVFDTDTYVATVAPLIKDPQVQHDIATTITDQALTASDLQNRIANVLPDRAAFLAGPITVQIGDFMQKELQQFLASPRAEQAWIRVNTVGHERLVAVLRGESKFVTINENNVTLNLLPLIGVALERIQARLPDILGSRIQLPQIDPNATPDEARAQLSAALGRPLPADFGTVTLLKGSQGHQVQQAVNLFDKLVVLIIIVTVALIVAAILVSPRRWYTVLELALGLLLGVVITKVVVAQLEKLLLDSIKKEGVVAVANGIVTSAVDKLATYLVWLIVLAVVVAVAAVIGTRPKWLDSAGRSVARLFRVSSDPSAPPTRTALWLAKYLDILKIAGVGVAVVVMLVIPKTWWWMLIVILALVAYELLLIVWAVGEGIGPEPKEKAAA